MRKQSSGLLFLFLACILKAQVDVGFTEHLLRKNLSVEHLAYLNTLPDEKDSTHYLYSKYYQQYFHDSLLLVHYHKSKRLCLSDQVFVKNTCRDFLNKTTDQKRELWFSTIADLPIDASSKELQRVYIASEMPKTFAADSLPEELRQTFTKYKRYSNKVPAVAAAMSALLPGLGKGYAGKTKSFLFSLTLCAAYAFQTIESANKLGTTHPFTIVNAGAFGIFYFSGIFGSYKAVLSKQKEYKKQFIIEATAYYN